MKKLVALFLGVFAVFAVGCGGGNQALDEAVATGVEGILQVKIS